ncbi:AraC family transcriptional regulator [Paenibacillus sp. JDR-2]|uniref:AraC family transcriptional regulator n=1 Tax=Paenibacillus sp. (strain JDR-2) TaxID=324057 RepID=UPI0001666B7D|nr:AraC family transcriptional regulator [Paenibacillus sp. JDR-2]ACT03125.1 transcriptional regulator, AraC family [Paenibacillus sp. JDR-2]
MHHSRLEWETFRSLLFHMLEARQWEIREDYVTVEQSARAYTLLLVAAGDCSLYADDVLIPALEQSCYILPPRQRWYISNYSGNPVQLYSITFKILNAETDQGFREPLSSNHYNWRLFPYMRAIKLAEQLTASAGEDEGAVNEQGEEKGMEWFSRRMLFTELVGMLLQHNSGEKAASGSLPSAERSVAFMEEHYMLQLSVKHLAEQAGMQPGQYALMVKQLTGSAPLEYLNQLRIKHAKMLLLTTDDPLREIARKVGFEDEYYFSRRFRQHTGMAPRQYAESMRGSKLVTDDAGHEVRIPLRPRRILYFGEVLGDLLALGVRPVGSNLYELGTSWLAEEENGLADIEDIGIPFRLGMARALEPDLIILSNMDERIYGEISAIAPTLVYNSYDPLLERMRRLGEWLDKEKEADSFTDQYSLRLKQASLMWKQRFLAGEKASVFICHRGHKWFVMGRLGLSELLHGMDENSLTGQIQELIAESKAYLMINPQDIAKYAGDIVFVPMPVNASARETTEQMLQSDMWLSIPAVRNGQAFVVEESRWNMYDAISRLRQLEHLQLLFG